MKDYAGIGDFRTRGLCVTQTIAVGGQAPRDAAVVSHDLASTTLTHRKALPRALTMQNTGSETWTADGTYALYSLNTPVNAFGKTLFPVTATTPSGASATFGLGLTVPLALGTYPRGARSTS